MSFFDYAWLIPLLPLAAFAFITFFSPLYRSKNVSSGVAIAAMLLATLLAWGVAFEGATAGFGAAGAEAAHTETEAGEAGEGEEHAAEGEHHFAGFGGAFARSFDWAATGDRTFRMGYQIDAPVAVMLAMVTLASLCIHIFSAGYMAEDRRYGRFFSYIALFTASMLGMVLADNLLLFFICWELMGLCSYLLIGFWYFRTSAYRAARKAFITTRIGDVLMMLGLFYLYREAGSLTFGTAEGQIFNAALLERIGSTTNAAGMLVATSLALLLFMGTVGKSAQFPLHVWLPDAMEGPTPVSALIHAATMVAAGVFLVARTYPIFLAGNALPVVAVVGTFTAVFAALIAVAQFDIKRILAYSTLSQLGFMVAALGIGGWVAGLFHLLTHAFFKALLFLGSGSVIHGMEAAVGHDPAKAQDIRNMGNLKRYMPTTWITYMIGYLALAGFPLFAGFWSKDEILADAFDVGFNGGSPIGIVVYVALSFATFLTAFYMTRQVAVVFWGPFRGMDPRRTDVEHSEKVAVETGRGTSAFPGDTGDHRGGTIVPDATPQSGYSAGGHDEYRAAVYETGGHDEHRAAVYETGGHDEHRAAIYDTPGHDEHHAHEPHESPWTMTLPLAILALFALGGGFVNAAPFGIHWLSHFLGQEAAEFNVLTAGIATALSVAGIGLGVLMYKGAFQRSTDADPLERMAPGLFRVLNRKFGVDEFYGATVGRLTDLAALALSVFDRAVDAVVNGVGKVSLFVSKVNFIFDDFFLNQGADTLAEVTTYTGDGMRQTTTGKIQDYGALIFLGALIIALIYLYGP
ncbi:MAG TPA: NADH-quinone oxidoreductase subunit L [Herpetosiphonaceae bacterium]|nr:NADH-quinone oxidoreductase subunit L [Herpetosiphonaceae bacterium]